MDWSDACSAYGAAAAERAHRCARSGPDGEYPADEKHMYTFNIDIIEEGGVLRFTLQGPGTYQNLLHAAATIISETKARNIWRVLCDATAMSRSRGCL